MLEEFGLEKDFLTALFSSRGDLHTESDWEFSLKCCALIESSINMAIKEVLYDDTYSKCLARMSVSGEPGKAGWLKSAKLIDQTDFNFIKEFFSIRNKYAHNVSNCSKPYLDFVTFEGKGKNWHHLEGPARRDEIFNKINENLRGILSISVYRVVLDLFCNLDRLKNRRIIEKASFAARLTEDQIHEARLLADHLGTIRE